MPLETIYFIGQTMAAGAIVLSLIYAGYQVRQNTRLARAQLTNDSSDGIHRFLFELGTNPDAAALWQKGLTAKETLSEKESVQFTFLMTSAFVGYENTYLIHRDALLASQMFDRSHRQMIFLFQQPGTRAWWRSNKLNLTTNFVAYVEREVIPTSELLNESQNMGSEARQPAKGPSLTPSND
ncbi:MAG: hypothetical protein EP340_03740 [Alphaproteobacteria bacterium]|nr:MAG: hypothetical protein EP340_03740 [Alphaproteobacteria bacterium]